MSNNDLMHFPTRMSPLQSYTGAMKHTSWPIAMLLFGSLCTASIGAQQPESLASRPNQFEVAALKLSAPDNRGTSWNGRSDRIAISNYTLRRLIRAAYNLKSDTQVLGGPDWLDKVHFDVSAKIDDTDVERFRGMTYEEHNHQIQLMLQAFLAERFQLKVEEGKQTLPVYLLVVRKSGPRLTESSTAKDAIDAKNRNHSTNTHNGHLIAKAISMDSFADYLTSLPDTGDRVVLNRTGLGGEFDFTLNWAEDFGGGIPSDASLPGLFTALPEQLGLALKSGESLIPVVEIQAASKPPLD